MIPIKEFDYEKYLDETPLECKPIPQGTAQHQFYFFDLLEAAKQACTEVGTPFGYSVCVKNDKSGSVYRTGCNQNVLNVKLDFDRFYKGGFSDAPGTVETTVPTQKAILNTEVRITSLGTGKKKPAKEFKIRLERLLELIENAAKVLELPCYYCYCVQGTGKSKDTIAYRGKRLFLGTEWTLTENRFRIYTMLAARLDPEEFYKKHSGSVSLDLTDTLDDFDDFDDFDEDEDEE